MIGKMIDRLFKGHRLKNIDDFERTIKEITAIAREKGVVDNFVANMLERILVLSRKEVGKIMVPRVDMISVSEDQPLTEAIEIYKKYGFSKMPIVSGRSDRVVGILYVKELLKNLDKIATSRVRDFKWTAHFIPESKKVLDTLRLFQRNHISIAIVVDEFGSVIGLVTLEDILEEIVGEIWEEFDKEEKLWRKIGDGEYEFIAKIDLDEVSKILGIEFDADDFHTLSGFIMSKIDKFPAKNTEIKYKGYKFIVTDATQQRIKKVRAIKLASDNS